MAIINFSVDAQSNEARLSKLKTLDKIVMQIDKCEKMRFTSIDSVELRKHQGVQYVQFYNYKDYQRVEEGVNLDSVFLRRNYYFNKGLIILVREDFCGKDFKECDEAI